MDGVPALGQHSQDILDQLGYSGDAIDSLRARGVI
jgi:itaconate CoA-transferase